MEIKVVSRWVSCTPEECPSCHSLKKRVEEALEELGIDVEVKNCESKEEYESYGVIVTPLLIINSKIKAMGNVPTKNRIKELIKEEM
ncbi:MAG: thioredoxin family protein [Candidatus Omnitrophota bacterium]